MSQPEATRVSRWEGTRSFATGKWRAVQFSIERRAFERKLEAIVRAALAHQDNGLPTGNHLYSLLKQETDSICTAFAGRWTIDPNLLEAKIPAIAKLKSLADPAPRPAPVVLVSLGLVIAAGLFFLMGVLAGLSSVGFHLIGGH